MSSSTASSAVSAVGKATSSVSANAKLAMSGTEGFKQVAVKMKTYALSCEASTTVVFMGFVAMAMHVYRFHKRGYKGMAELVFGIIGDLVRMIIGSLVIAFACDYVSASLAGWYVSFIACSLYADVFWELFTGLF